MLRQSSHLSITPIAPIVPIPPIVPIVPIPPIVPIRPIRPISPLSQFHLRIRELIGDLPASCQFLSQRASDHLHTLLNIATFGIGISSFHFGRGQSQKSPRQDRSRCDGFNRGFQLPARLFFFFLFHFDKPHRRWRVNAAQRKSLGTNVSDERSRTEKAASRTSEHAHAKPLVPRCQFFWRRMRKKIAPQYGIKSFEVYSHWLLYIRNDCCYSGSLLERCATVST
jgi:hypothetical protein